MSYRSGTRRRVALRLVHAVLLSRLGEDGGEQRLLVRPRRGDAGGDPVRPIGGFADGVRVGDQRLTFIRVLERGIKGSK